jgi:beta-aspartyl-peptidase (threonine type)
MFSIAIHGGAGLSTRNLSAEEETAYLQAMESTLRYGYGMLAKGASALETVQATIVLLEDNPIFNAGRGAVLNHRGQAECDAALMDGKTRTYGGVTGSTRLRNPILGARFVMNETPHLLICGEGADQLPIPKENPEYFITDKREQQLAAALKASRVTLDHEEAKPEDGDSHGTVGAVALDSQGHTAAGSSTGGMTNKMVGRVGDSPIIGAGLYADDETCAITCTGRGERFLANLLAHRVSNLMEIGELTLELALKESFARYLSPGDGGAIALDPSGAIYMPFNTAGMIRGAADSKGRFETAIW